MPHIDLWEPCCFTKVPGDPQTYSINAFWLQDGGAQIHMSEWSQNLTVTKDLGRGFILCSTPVHNGLSESPIRWSTLLRILCPVGGPVTASYCVLLKERNLALAPGEGPEINCRSCLWVSPRPRHNIQCWLTNQRLILHRISCPKTTKAGSGPKNFRTELSLASLSSISLPPTPACPKT